MGWIDLGSGQSPCTFSIDRFAAGSFCSSNRSHTDSRIDRFVVRDKRVILFNIPLRFPSFLRKFVRSSPTDLKRPFSVGTNGFQSKQCFCFSCWIFWNLRVLHYFILLLRTNFFYLIFLLVSSFKPPHQLIYSEKNDHSRSPLMRLNCSWSCQTYVCNLSNVLNSYQLSALR